MPNVTQINDQEDEIIIDPVQPKRYDSEESTHLINKQNLDRYTSLKYMAVVGVVGIVITVSAFIAYMMTTHASHKNQPEHSTRTSSDQRQGIIYPALAMSAVALFAVFTGVKNKKKISALLFHDSTQSKLNADLAPSHAV